MEGRLGRTFRVLFDILTIRFLLKYFTRPMLFLGSQGLVGTSLSSLILLYCAGDKLIRGHDIMLEHGPLMMLGSLLVVAG